ncbi:MAG TPA: PEP-CTERM-box response regulator transcription factor [Verrucomicrobiae bacterium]|nr:PEP-CTERM-box response regulator transcription factor [Verrucomicrobiae bacterium]
MNSRLLIVEDDDEIRTQMKWALGKDYEIVLVENRASALESFRSTRPSVVLLDLGLPPRPGSPEEGLAALSEILAIDRLAKVIIVTGQNEKETALQAVGAGAYDFLCKPIEMEELKLLLKRCFHVAGLEREYRAMRELIQGDSFEGMLGNSRPMQAVFDAIRKVSTTDVPVLILGESGTGKEMVAHAIHQRSNRKNGPFVPINCSAIPETLLESELFGHEKGAFTGAHIQRKGRIESAAGGTLFLDEIGEIPHQLQVKLLRFLQEQRIARVGGRDEFHVDTRVVTATNADLKKTMAAGTFREDLFYRLAVVQISMPPLRERENDISLLAQAFLNRFAAQIPKKGLAFDRDAIRAINAHQWPGNVRELENSVRRAVIMAEGKHLTAKDLGLTSAMTGNVATLKSAREALEREFIQRALRKHAGKITAAATDLGVSRPTLYELMEKLEIARD